MFKTRLKVFLLYASYSSTTSYYEDWIDAFQSHDKFICYSLNILSKSAAAQLKKNIANVDLVILLHSTNADNVGFLSPYINILNSRKCKLLIFVGNEYNSPIYGARMGDKIALMQSIMPEYIATQLPIDTATKIYEDLQDSIILELPPALNPCYFKPTNDFLDRSIDIGARSYSYYPFLGDNERNVIMEYFSNLKFSSYMKIDIETDPSKRFSRPDWAKFLNKCKFTVSTEAGTYYIEKDDFTVKKISRFLKRRLPLWKRFLLELNESRFRNYIRRALNIHPYGVGKAKSKLFDPNKIYYQITFEEVYEVFFKNYRNPLNGKCISSRHFDAIGTKTCQIMFTGKFNGILKPYENYIPLNRDFSDIELVLNMIKDEHVRNKIVDNTYEYVMDCHTYKHRVDKVFEVVCL